ncbi:MAG: DUF1573 domain-containing protein [Candidatus Omnitrophica bacterium]|nr:DUF1573 domain-containing protein [Candidatus Omnitrophota bacterium]
MIEGGLKMKGLLVFASIMLFLLCILVISIPLGAEPKTDATVTATKACMSFPEPIFDFGFVYQGEDVTHAFKFQNVGESTLKISRVQASCGCSKAEASDTEIAPGAFGQIGVTFRTGGFIGQQTKIIHVNSNDPINPTIDLQLKGEVKIEVEVKPLTLSFENVSKHEQVTKQFEIIQRGEQKLIIDKVTTDKEYLKIDSVEKREQWGKNVYSVKVTLDSNAPAGYLQGRIDVSTNLERRKTILVGVQGRILGDIKLSRERIDFNVPAGTKKASSVVISTKGDNFEVLRVENNIKYLSAEVITLEKFKKYMIDFSVAPEVPPGPIRGNVKIYTNCPGETELTVHIFGRVVEKTTEKAIEIGYFFEKGCLDCERVHSILGPIKEEFPAVVVKEYDISTRENMQLNETLCEMYGVPEEKRMVTPAIFIGKDFLAGESITKEKLTELINKYKDGTSLPLERAAQVKDVVEGNVVDRLRSFGVLAIIGAGLMDGINPCAFATIIFFISYLAILKRKGREIIIVGIAFTSALFITYFLIGIGIFEFLNYLSFLKTFTKFIYGIVGVFTLILGILSLLDYFKCKRGKAKEMWLQLPDFLKRRIHSTIKEQAGLRRYVLAAFITGFIVSILELSCTGQVYLPTIVYATGISEYRFVAYTYLLIYNLMFIAPLIVIFILAYWGTTAVRLSDILGGNIALIKLLMSILFFILTAFLIMMLIV